MQTGLHSLVYPARKSLIVRTFAPLIVDRDWHANEQQALPGRLTISAQCCSNSGVSEALATICPRACRLCWIAWTGMLA
jgi:hypothetical protein